MSQEEKPSTGKVDGVKPEVGFPAVPLWMLVLCGSLFYWGTLYLDGHAGGYNQDVYEPYTSYAEVDKVQPRDTNLMFVLEGKDIFDHTCSLCHQPTGEGKPGQYPPLAGSDWLAADGPNRIGRIVLFGLSGTIHVNSSKVGPIDLNASMAALGGTYTDEQLAAALTYVRQRKDWGNNASKVTPDQIAAIRAEVGHHGPFSPDDLLKLPVAMPSAKTASAK